MVEMDSTQDKVLDGQDVSDDQKPMYNKVQVSDVVRREVEKAKERGRKEAMEEFNRNRPVENFQQPSQPQTMGGMPSMSEDQYRKIAAEESTKAFQNQVKSIENTRIANSFIQKIQAAEGKYPGLEAKVAKLDFSTIAPLVGKINDAENTAEIMDELLKNPLKLANLTTLAYTQPELIQDSINSLSGSIKQNMLAQSQQSANEPLDQVRTSNIGMDNGSSRSVRDFTEKYRGKL